MNWISAVLELADCRMAVSSDAVPRRFTVSWSPGLELALVVRAPTFENWTDARPGEPMVPAPAPVGVRVSANEATLLYVRLAGEPEPPATVTATFQGS